MMGMSSPGMDASAMRRWLARAQAFVLSIALVAVQVQTAEAQSRSGRGLPVIRDAEIEQLLRDYLTPILKVAGLTSQNIQVVIINDRSFNAFVVDGRRIFVNAGALLDSKTPNQLIGVLAHEAGHIAGGHLAKIHRELASAQTAAIIGMILGAGAIAAGAMSGGRGDGLTQAGMAGLTMQPAILQRSLLSYQRAQEEAADRAGVRFLTATQQSAKGMYETFKRLSDNTLFMSQGADPYMQSHPMPRERVAALEEIARTSPHWQKTDSPELQLKHDLAKAKLVGFMDRADTAARRYPLSDTGLAARYARAISAYRHSDLRTALTQIDALIAASPNNPYFHELKGQALLENGRAREALAPLRRALTLAPNAQLIRIMLGQALVATNDPALLGEAITTLRTALLKEPEVSDGYRHLAVALGRKGETAEADLASARAAFVAGDIKTARELAGRARLHFPTGSPGWVKADDIYSYKPPAGSRSN